MKIIWAAFFVHFIFLASVFDIYFTSPIVHGISPQQNTFASPAKRLVLFVADGMRADTLFYLGGNKTEAPFLRNIIEKKGTWGVSHTRVPTESRPGHVAIIAGLYEDPSAIARGWKENPVEFDSLFNRSQFTWAWGSPDILPMFSKASGSHMWTEMYASEDQDFSGGKRGTSWLDEWVYSRFESFMKYVKMKTESSGEEVQGSYHWKLIHEDRIVFFLHLLATDTAGHTFKPHSWEYQKNVNLLDKGVKKVVDMVENLYNNDGKTAYIVTSDHGMTDWGSHGAGDPSETQTPLIAWGAGIPGPMSSSSEDCVNDPNWPVVLDRDWNLSMFCRHDVWQADIAPLMSTLLGVPIPVNSVGYLHRSYLDLNNKEMAEAAFTNAMQMLSQHIYRRMQLEYGKDCRMWYCLFNDWIPTVYVPFPALSPEDEELRIQKIQNLIFVQDYKKAMIESDQLFRVALSGVEYHQRYHRTFLLGCTSFSFIGWICVLMLIASSEENSVHIELGVRGIVDFPFIIMLAFTMTYLFVLGSPVQYYTYCLLPFLLWWMVVRLVIMDRKRRAALYEMCHNWKNALSASFLLAVYLCGIEILVVSFFHRWVLSLGMVGLASHPLLTVTSRSLKSFNKDSARISLWVISCFTLGVFPFVPVIGKDVNTTLVVIAGLLFIALGMLGALLYTKMQQEGNNLWGYLRMWPFSLWIQLFVLLPLALWNIVRADNSFKDMDGLPLICQILSWALSGLSLLHWHLNQKPRQSCEAGTMQKLLSVCLSMSVPYLLLSVSHEGLFLLALLLNSQAWVQMETNNFLRTASRRITRDDLRRSFSFVFLIVASFFGTGNVASINSFDPAWVRRFLSVFSAHLMGALILAKTFIPFLIISSAFRTINLLLKAPPKRLFLIVLAISDACGLHFLHLVKDKGSWLDIGSSLSHFVIQEAMALFLLLLYCVSCVLIPDNVEAACKEDIYSSNASVSVALAMTSSEDDQQVNRRKNKVS